MPVHVLVFFLLIQDHAGDAPVNQTFDLGNEMLQVIPVKIIPDQDQFNVPCILSPGKITYNVCFVDADKLVDQFVDDLVESDVFQ